MRFLLSFPFLLIVRYFLYCVVSDLLKSESTPALDREIAGLLDCAMAHPSIPRAVASWAGFTLLGDEFVISDEDQDRARSHLNLVCAVAGWKI